MASKGTKGLMSKVKYRLNIFNLILDRENEIKDLLLYLVWKEKVINAKNPLNRYGAKYFSQTDEDGITLEIIDRIGLKKGVYAEFGVGDGSENNTLILIANRWKGFWVGSEKLFFNYDGRLKNFVYLREWITKENIVELSKKGLYYLDKNKIDVVSIDLDGNDYYFVDELLKNGIKPELFIVEYNAKFPPYIKFKIDYDPNNSWIRDDYFGASLTSFVDLFKKYGYMLVCCNSHSGANAFFVRSVYKDMFKDVPHNLNHIYQNIQYITYESFGHKPSPRTIEQLLKDNDRYPG